MREDPNKIEFHFFRIGGSAAGPFAIKAFSRLCAAGLIAIVVISLALIFTKNGWTDAPFAWMARIRGP